MTKIWIEPICHPDGSANYSSRGQLYRTKLGGVDGPVLCTRTITPILDSCRALLACGITGQFETWHEGDSFARITGEITNVAKLDVKEGPVRLVRYEPLGTAERCRKPARLGASARARPRPIWPPPDEICWQGRKSYQEANRNTHRL
jgi:hypothetical protein